MAREGLMDDSGYMGFEEPEYPCDKCAHKDDCDEEPSLVYVGSGDWALFEVALFMSDKLRVLCFHPALAPYRLDFFNRLAELVDFEAGSDGKVFGGGGSVSAQG